MTFLEAIAKQEGFYVPGSRPQRNNSPGDLAYGSEAIRFGASGADGRYAVFPDVDTGWQALRRWLSVPAKYSDQPIVEGQPKGPNGYLVGGYRGATLEQVIFRFAPPEDSNNTSAYVANVESWTGLTADTIIDEHLGVS